MLRPANQEGWSDAGQGAKPFGSAASTVRAIDQRYLDRLSRQRKKKVTRQFGVDEFYLGKRLKFLTVVSYLESGEPLRFGSGRQQETLDEFFREHLNPQRRQRLEAACVDMWEPFTKRILRWAL